MTITFDDAVYTRDSGATRVNAQGLIVGVDFSVTSVTFGLGAQTFTLAADANVNRDWPVGSRVRATSQASPLGLMNGTVTSYDPATQALVIEVTESTGTGTGTNWRIGSLEFRRDFDPVTLAPKGGLVEGGSTNGHRPSVFLTPTTIGNNSITPVNGEPTMGYAFEVTADTASTAPVRLTINQYPLGTSIPDRNVRSIYCKKINARYVSLRRAAGPNGVTFDLDTGQVLTSGTGSGVRAENFFVRNVGNGWYRFGFLGEASTNIVSNDFQIGYGNAVDTGNSSTNIVTQIGEKVLLAYPSMYIGSNFDDSPIPTTTVAVTRAADLLSVEGANYSQAINPTQGTLLVECIPTDSVNGQTVASLNDGTADNDMRIAQKNSGTRSSIRAVATDGVTDVMAVSAVPNNVLVSDGVSYTPKTNFTGGTPTSQTAFGVANNGSQFLTVGSAEIIRPTSDKGATFKEVGHASYSGAHYGIGRFVMGVIGPVAGFSGVTISTDGISFRRIVIEGLAQTITEVTSNGTNQYVAVGSGGVIYTSPDAETWTAQVSGVGTAAFAGVHFFGGRYVAVTSNAQNTRYSDDGITWLGTSGLNATMFDVYHNGTDLWVAVGTGGAIYSSADGITWTQQTSPVSVTLRGIHFADGLWVAVGDAGTVVTSPDGITWTDRTATAAIGAANNLAEVFFFNGLFLAAGTNAVFTNTTAGITGGTAFVNRPAAVIATNLAGFATNGSLLLTCGSAGGIATSPDGTTFTSRTGNNATLNGAAFGNGTYVVVGNAVNGSGLIATVDPVTFAYTRRVSGTTGNIANVRFLNGAFYAMGNNIAGDRLRRSADGTSWSALGSLAVNYFDMAFGNDVYVAVGQTGRSATSQDGITFTEQPNNTTQLSSQSNAAISFANGVFVAVAANGTISTSPNGTTWTLRTSGTTADLYAVQYSTRDQQWYAYGDNGTILRSADAITWASISNDATVGVFDGGSLQANPVAGKFIPNQTNRIALGYDANGVSLSINGGDVITDPSVTLPLMSQLNIGTDGLNANPLNAHIKTKTYRVKVTDAELQALSRVF